MPKTKLVVFDLDQTLIDTRLTPAPQFSGFCTMINYSPETQPLYIYMRPHAKVALEMCRSDPRLFLVLFSAAEPDYVQEVVDSVIYPNMDAPFYFDAICTKKDLDGRGMKDMEMLRKRFKIKDVLLVDDNPYQCEFASRSQNADVFRARPFKIDAEGALGDRDLILMLLHPFFYSTEIRGFNTDPQ